MRDHAEVNAPPQPPPSAPPSPLAMLRPAAMLLLLLTLLTGIVYPLVVTVIARTAVPARGCREPARCATGAWSDRR